MTTQPSFVDPPRSCCLARRPEWRRSTRRSIALPGHPGRAHAEHSQRPGGSDPPSTAPLGAVGFGGVGVRLVRGGGGAMETGLHPCGWWFSWDVGSTCLILDGISGFVPGLKTFSASGLRFITFHWPSKKETRTWKNMWTCFWQKTRSTTIYIITNHGEILHHHPPHPDRMSSVICFQNAYVDADGEKHHWNREFLDLATCLFLFPGFVDERRRIRIHLDDELEDLGLNCTWPLVL